MTSCHSGGQKQTTLFDKEDLFAENSQRASWW